MLRVLRAIRFPINRRSHRRSDEAGVWPVAGLASMVTDRIIAKNAISLA
jgi:hypothetical protein